MMVNIVTLTIYNHLGDTFPGMPVKKFLEREDPLLEDTPLHGRVVDRMKSTED